MSADAKEAADQIAAPQLLGPQHAPDDGNVPHTSANGSLVSLALPSRQKMKERRHWIGQLTWLAFSWKVMVVG
jgi:hypothetical protein